MLRRYYCRVGNAYGGADGTSQLEGFEAEGSGCKDRLLEISIEDSQGTRKTRPGGETRIMTAALNGRSIRFERREFLPAILISTDAKWCDPVVNSLKLDGYVVFETSCAAEALVVLISQTRPIDILLADATIGGQELARNLKLYRREMRILFVTTNSQQLSSDGLHPQNALAKVREILQPPEFEPAGSQGSEVTLACSTSRSRARAPEMPAECIAMPLYVERPYKRTPA